jgi:hypothetical protein
MTKELFFKAWLPQSGVFPKLKTGHFTLFTVLLKIAKL